ncbi:MAG: peptidoglycan DD-metalloendopeptidase family protein [Oscillospiraceae bacterium]|nr:peptidoglycan DD-metalloendopeptidase family protein [Oscillospiraceae bacterium]
MTNLFQSVIQMSVSASYVIAVILMLRLFLHRFPKKYSYLLWSVAAFRLCCPFSVPSMLSIFNLSFKRNEQQIVDLTEVTQIVGKSSEAPISVGIPQINDTLETVFVANTESPSVIIPNETSPYTSTDMLPPAAVSHTTRMPVTTTDILAAIWIVGVVAFLCYSFISFYRMKKKMEFSMPLRDNIRQAEIRSPFILGYIHPIIYIPFGLDPLVENIAISHERHHIHRKDHWIKLFSFILLSLHWMNPLCWIAYYEMGKDLEMSCDEYVLAHYRDISKNYSRALLSFSTEKRFSLASPLAFGESNVKERIVNAMKYKKAKRMITVCGVILCFLILVSCGTNSIHSADPNQQFTDEGTVVIHTAQENEPLVFTSFPVGEPYGGIVRGYWPNQHRGYDIWGKQGTDILAVADGTVDIADEDEKYGKYVVIKHSNGYQTLYAHCDELLVQRGDIVQGGELIARMGSSGYSTGTHLHFELRDETGYIIDPTLYLDVVYPGLAEKVFDARSEPARKEEIPDAQEEHSQDIQLHTLKEVCSTFAENYCNQEGIHLTTNIASRFQPEQLWNETHSYLTDYYQLHLHASFGDPVLSPDCTIEGCDHQSPSCHAWTLKSEGYPIELPLENCTLRISQVQLAVGSDYRLPSGKGVLIRSISEQTGVDWETAIPNVTLVDGKMYFDGQYLIICVSNGIQVLDTNTGEIVKKVFYESAWTNSLYLTTDNNLVLVDKGLKLGYMIDTKTWQKTKIKDIINGPDWYKFTYDWSCYTAVPLFDSNDLPKPDGTDHSQIFMINGEKGLVRFSSESHDEAAIVDLNSGKILSGTVPMKNIYGEDIPIVYMESEKYYVFRSRVMWNSSLFPSPPNYYDGLNNENTATYRYIYAFIEKEAFWNGSTEYTEFVMQ